MAFIRYLLVRLMGCGLSALDWTVIDYISCKWNDIKARDRLASFPTFGSIPALF